jgi:hypothetical protein
MSVSDHPLSALPVSSTPDTGVLLRFACGPSLSIDGLITINGNPQTGTEVEGQINFNSEVSLRFNGSVASGLGGTLIIPVTVNAPTTSPSVPSTDANVGGLTVYHTGGPRSSTFGTTDVRSDFTEPILGSPDSPTGDQVSPHFSLDSLDVSFDNGKQLAFREVNVPSYGMPG